MRIYADTSVFGGVFDEEFAEPTKQFFSEIDAGRFVIVTSAIVEAEIEPAPKKIRDFFARYEMVAEIAQITQEMFCFNSSISTQVLLLQNLPKTLCMSQLLR